VIHEVPLSAPLLDDDDRRVVAEVLAGRVLSIGPWVERFEAELAAASDRRFAVAMSSGTAALHLIVRALGWKAGDEVVTTPFSFVASANCLLYEGVRPVFVDIDPHTRCLDPARVEAAITPRTVGILSVDVFGHPADWPALEAIAARHQLTLVTDSCESLGSARSDGPGRVAAGKSGAAGAFAFYPNKQITTGEGGAVVTDDERIARLCRSMRNQGRDEGAGWLQHARLGYNYRLSELNAALGVSQARRLADIRSRRAEVARRYAELLAPLAGVVAAPAAIGLVEICWFVYVVQLADGFGAAERDAILGGLRGAGIGCSNYFSPIHLQPYVREALGCGPGDFPVTEQIAGRTIALPFHTALDAGSQRRVVDELARQIAAHGPRGALTSADHA
jgi:perosamine synthetase